EALGALERLHHRRHLVGLGAGAEGGHHARAPALGRGQGEERAHGVSSPSRLTSARRSSDTAAMSTTVETSVARVRTGGVLESSMPITPSAMVAIQRITTVRRLEPERSRRMSWMWSLAASAGLAPRRRRRSVTWV